MFCLIPLLLSAPINFEQLKQEIIENEQRLVAATEEEQGVIYYQLARAYYHDQELDKAFLYFLKALEKTPPAPSEKKMTRQEKALYEEAIAYYNAQSGVDPGHLADSLLEKFGKIAEENPRYFYLNFVLATAYANSGDFDAFLERFYVGYPYLSDTFLAFKTKGVLYLRLARITHDKKQKSLYHAAAVREFSQALELNKMDSGLYKVLIFLAKDAKKDPLVLSCLQTLLESGASIARGDIYPYVYEAIALKEYTLAQALIDRAKGLYTFSRSIQAAQEYLDQQQR